MSSYLLLIAYVVAIMVPSSFAQHPYDWRKTGTNPEGYEIGEDEAAAKEQPGRWKVAAYLRAIDPQRQRFGALIQTIEADDYRNARVRLTAWIKTEDVTGWAGMWMRIDGHLIRPSDPMQVLGFDNMCRRPILGTAQWLKYSIVLDVPPKAEQIYYGVLLSPTGPHPSKHAKAGDEKQHRGGTVWLKDVEFEIVDKHLQTTRTLNCPEWAQTRY